MSAKELLADAMSQLNHVYIPSRCPSSLLGAESKTAAFDAVSGLQQALVHKSKDFYGMFVWSAFAQNLESNHRIPLLLVKTQSPKESIFSFTEYSSTQTVQGIAQAFGIRSRLWIHGSQQKYRRI